MRTNTSIDGRLLFFLFSIVLFNPIYCAFSAPIRIMPLGDSITSSTAGHASYRHWLWKQLANRGYQVDFVGTQKGVWGGEPVYKDFDQDHEGHYGWTADNVLSQIQSWASAYHPQVVLIHLGSNDVYYGQPIISTIEELRRIIKTLRSVNPKIKIFLAKVIPSKYHNKALQKLNANIPILASQMRTSKSPVIVVDQYAGFDVKTDTYDGEHPNERGEKKIASKWMNAMLPTLRHLRGSPGS